MARQIIGLKKFVFLLLQKPTFSVNFTHVRSILFSQQKLISASHFFTIAKKYVYLRIFRKDSIKCNILIFNQLQLTTLFGTQQQN